MTQTDLDDVIVAAGLRVYRPQQYMRCIFNLSNIRFCIASWLDREMERMIVTADGNTVLKAHLSLFVVRSDFLNSCAPTRFDSF